MELPTEIRKQIYEYNNHTNFTQNDKKQMYSDLFQSEPFRRSMMLIDACGFLKDEELSEARHRYGKYDFIQTANWLRDFTK